MCILQSVYFQLKLDKTGFVPGENMDMTVEVSNESNGDLKLIVSLLQECKYKVTNVQILDIHVQENWSTKSLPYEKEVIEKG